MANRQPHYVAPLSETPLLAVDSVTGDSQPSNLWLDAWRDMRGRPMFYISGALILLVVVVARFPSWFTRHLQPNRPRNIDLVDSGHPRHDSDDGRGNCAGCHRRFLWSMD